MHDPDPPQTQNWADFIDSLHVFNPPLEMRGRLHRHLTDLDSRDAVVPPGTAGSRFPQSGPDPSSLSDLG